MMLDREIKPFEGIAAVSGFVTNLLTIQQPQGAGRRRPVVTQVGTELVSNRIIRKRHPADGGPLLPLVYSSSPTYSLSPQAPAADGRIRHLKQARDEQTEGQAPRSAHDRQPLLDWALRGRMLDERKFIDLGPGSLVSRWIGMPLPAAQVHSGTFTNRLLSTYHADAMTFGRHIYIKTHKFDPHSASGLALLAHEFTHVSQQLPESGELIHDSPSKLEERALNKERLVLLHAQAHLGSQNFPVVSHVPGSVQPSPPPERRGPPAPLAGPGLTPGTHHTQDRPLAPMFAVSSRSMGPPEPPAISGGLSDRDIVRIKEEVYQDLMWRIKTEFERGS